MASRILILVVVTVLAYKNAMSHPIKFDESRLKLPDLGEDPLKCAMCLETMKEIFKLASANRTIQCVEALADKGCKLLHIEDTTVCNDVVSEYGNILAYVITDVLLDPHRICNALFAGCGGPMPPNPDGPWSVNLNATKPPRVKPVLPDPSKPKIRVVHLADLHFDKYYAPGSEADCGEPLCCRQTNATSVKKPAGKWGTTGDCDLPLATIENLFQHIASRNDYDYIIWTGDAPPHNVWDQTKSDQIGVLDTLNQLFSKYFSNKLLISAVGNHESAPANNYPPHQSKNIPNEYSTAWLFQTFADQWTKYGIGNDSTTYQSIQNLASYVTRPYPGLRVISLNTMYGLEGNFWLYMNEDDPDQVLQWLIRELQSAENAGDKVHIIGHVPPGDTCLKEWSANFYDIINRYENTIASLFYGHTHKDSFAVFYENGSLSDPIHVAYVSPSATSYSNYWPSYRIYTLDGNYDGSSYRVLDHETYMLNLDDANQSDQDPQWELEYTAKDAYQMDSLLPEAWADLINRFVLDDELFQKYNRYNGRAPVDQCKHKCKYDALCEMRRGKSHDDENLCADLPHFLQGATNVRTEIDRADLDAVQSRVKNEFSILPLNCQF